MRTNSMRSLGSRVSPSPSCSWKTLIPPFINPVAYKAKRKLNQRGLRTTSYFGAARLVSRLTTNVRAPHFAISSDDHLQNSPMQRLLASVTIVLLLGMVITRVLLMRRSGIRAMHFGQIDKKDFLIPPFALFYFYIVFAAAFGLPTVSAEEIFHSAIIEWLGVAFCFAGLSLLLWSLISFGKNFRVGIDTSRPGKLVTDGIFAYSRNPIYVGFAFILIGQFLILSNRILLIYVLAGFWLFHRQVLREEEYLRKHYGDDYTQYCRRVRRYL